MSDWPSPEDVREDLIEDVEGLLSVFERGARDPEGLLELLAAGQGLRRLDATEEITGLSERAGTVLRGVDPGAFETARHHVDVETWLLDLRDLAARFDVPGESEDGRSDREFAEEAQRLIRQLDSWRLGLIGLLALTEDEGEVTTLREDLSLLEDGPVTEVMTRPELFGPVGAFAEAHLRSFREDLEDVDLDLAVTGDIFAAITLAVSPAARGEDVRSLLEAVERPVHAMPRLLPPLRLDAAADLGASEPFSMVWLPEDGTAEAYLDFIPASEEEESSEPIELRLEARTDESRWSGAWRIRLFGIAAPLANGRASFLRTDLRAAERDWTGASLLVLDPGTARWTPWPMRDSEEMSP